MFMFSKQFHIAKKREEKKISDVIYRFTIIFIFISKTENHLLTQTYTTGNVFFLLLLFLCLFQIQLKFYY